MTDKSKWLSQLQHLTPGERAILDEILVAAETSRDVQMELVAVLRSGCTLEQLVSNATIGG